MEEDSEFLIPQEQRRGFRISDPQTTLEIQNSWSPKQHGRGFRISDPRLTQERIQNFWPPNNTGDSEFLTTKQYRRGFRISDRQTEHWRFRISDPQTTQEIQNFWPPNNTGEDSEFLTPKLNTGDSEFQIPQTRQERIQNFWFPKQKYNTGRFSIFQKP